MGQFKLLD